MEDIELIGFEVIKQYADYKHFAIHYNQSSMQCVAQGIAWISRSHANYYISSVLINSELCKHEDMKLAGIRFQDFSMKLKCAELESFLMEEIRKHERSRKSKWLGHWR